MAGLAFGTAMLGTLLLGCAISTFLNITLLWSISNDGAFIFLTALVTLFSGLIVPLPLFPGWAQSFLMILPFAGLSDLPYRLYTGNIEPGWLPLILVHQVLWTGVIVGAGRWMLRRGMRRVVVQGG
jgi:ABC-2 type transport system permease protein